MHSFILCSCFKTTIKIMHKGRIYIKLLTDVMVFLLVISNCIHSLSGNMIRETDHDSNLHLFDKLWC